MTLSLPWNYNTNNYRSIPCHSSYHSSMPLPISITSFYVWQVLFAKHGLTNFWNDLFVTRPFLVTSWKCFLQSDTHIFLWILNKISFSLIRFIQNLFLRRLRSCISFLCSLFVKGAWFPLESSFLLGHTSVQF